MPDQKWRPSKEYLRNYRKMYRARMIEQGKCTRCLSQPAREGMRSCEACSEKVKAMDARRHANETPEERRQRLEYNRERYAANPEYYKAEAKRYRDKVKREAMDAYGGVCACCGESHLYFLTLHHINGDGYAHRASLMNEADVKRVQKFGPRFGHPTSKRFYSIMRRLGWPDVGLQVLCWNCHEALEHYGECPHKTGYAGH